MAKTLDPRDFNRKVSYNSPLIYFYYSDIPSFDRSIFDYMNKLATEYPDLRVFMINWEIHLKYFALKPSEEIYKVYLYFNNKLYDEKFKPDKKEMNEIFKKAIQLFNLYAEIKANNIGTKAMNIKLNGVDDSYERKLKRRLDINERIKRKILETRIVFKHSIDESETMNIKKEILSKNDRIFKNDQQSNDSKNTNEIVKTTGYQINRDFVIQSVFYNATKNDYCSYISKNYAPKILQNSNKFNDSITTLNFPPRNDYLSYDTYLKDDKQEPKSLKKYFLKRLYYKKNNFMFS